MLRTILFFLAFLVLLISELSPVMFYEQAILIRFSPFLMLIVILLWSWFGKQHTVQLKKLNTTQARIIKVLSSLSAFFIVMGALLRLLHVSFAQWGIILGLGSLSVWSWYIYRYTKKYKVETPDIIDSEEDDDIEED